MSNTPHRRDAFATSGLIAFIAFVSLFPRSGVVCASDDDVKTQVIGREKAWSDAVIAHDAARVASILADDFVGIDGRRFISNKAEELKEAAPPAQDSNAPVLMGEDLSDCTVRIYGDTAVLTCTNAAHFKSNDNESQIKYRRTTVWVRQSNEWRCVSFHGSRILENPLSATPAR